MNGTLNLNPFLGIIFAAFLQNGIVISYAIQTLIPGIKTKNSHTKELWQNLLGGILWVDAILFLDMGLAWILGAWGWGDWTYQLPSALLLVIVGVEYVYVTIFHKFRWSKLALFLSFLIAWELSIRWWVAGIDVMFFRLDTAAPLLLLSVILGNTVYAIIVFILDKRKVKKFPEESKVDRSTGQGFWELGGTAAGKVFSKPLNIALWILITLQAMFIFTGYSWITIWWYPK